MAMAVQITIIETARDKTKPKILSTAFPPLFASDIFLVMCLKIAKSIAKIDIDEMSSDMETNQSLLNIFYPNPQEDGTIVFDENAEATPSKMIWWKST